MRVFFEKFQGAGNDFVMIDKRSLKNPLTRAQIAFLCDRHFGIGADGLMMLEPLNEEEVRMDYFNADGMPAGLCGNGARCTAAWMGSKTAATVDVRIFSTDGIHPAKIIGKRGDGSVIRLEMADQGLPQEQGSNAWFMDTGSPHHIIFVEDPSRSDVQEDGSRIRNSARYAPYGTNVNFARKEAQELRLRTFERGVEAETLACGTGAVATALTQAFLDGRKGPGEYQVSMPGGKLIVQYVFQGSGFTNVFLEGPAAFVFSGEIILPDNEQDRETQA